ncbi:conserved hypothetical protein [Talaromyces stipitatus ATCC 10500]|uniref:FAS1 domain-containing protein n=1 Tax=Talaromyces stipitatus (strain ATCC 10500 / CBS 375.48 / QM 6759 / NRRL 1006) TaxID=441959 RepID=B8MQJ9_TALSN|nr:uncharacterized protein TSTA_058890 [Talaromyces stipitatus ATCC 10500]EED13401.1 conserved hypothetical protein [Talaromyces stipitatus ATCC 10500]
MKKTSQNIQLAIYATILSLTIAWLVISIADTAVLALREWDFLPSCVTRHQRPQPFKIEYLEYIDDEYEDNLDIPSAQNVLMPPITGGGGSDGDDKNTNLIVSDLLVKTPKINVFASLTRDFQPIASRLNDKSQNTTVLAPLNSAINSLPRKPWEDPADYDRFGEAKAYNGEEGQDRAKRNLQRFVEAHLVPVSPWREGEEVETVGGAKVKWVKEGETVFIEPGHVEVESLASEVSNGNVWVLKGVVNYQ